MGANGGGGAVGDATCKEGRGGGRNGTKEGKEEQGEREENLGASLASGLLGTADSLRGYFKV